MINDSWLKDDSDYFCYLFIQNTKKGFESIRNMLITVLIQIVGFLKIIQQGRYNGKVTDFLSGR